MTEKVARASFRIPDLRVFAWRMAGKKLASSSTADDNMFFASAMQLRERCGDDQFKVLSGLVAFARFVATDT